MPAYEQRKELFDKYYTKIEHQTGSRVMLLEHQISDKVLANVKKRIMPKHNSDRILGFMDTTVMASGKNGYVFTERHLYYLETIGKPVHIRYKDIANLFLEDGAEEDKHNTLYIELSSGEEYKVFSPFLNKTPLYHYLQEAIDLEKNETTKPVTQEQEVHNVSTKENREDYGALAAGMVYGNISNASTNYSAEKMNTPRGHGFAAENANHLSDKIKNMDFFGQDKVQLVGDEVDPQTNRIMKDGADRIVNGVNIQTKYCSSGSKCIAECFEDGKMRYINADGSPMQIEVPKDMHEDAIKAMENRIRKGEVPGVSNPDEAKNIVKPGDYTYTEAKNIAKAGNIDSLKIDAQTGAITASYAAGISVAISFALSIWNGEDMDIALKKATQTGLKTFGNVFAVGVLSGQLSKAGINSALVKGSEKIVEMLGPKASSVLANAFKSGTNIYGTAVMKSVSNMLRSNVVTGALSIAVLSTADLVNIFRGRISGQQLFKNVTTLTASMAGGGLGFVGGAAIGSVVPGVGTIVGGLLGSVAGGSVSGKAANKVLSNFVEDDADAMSDILEQKFSEMARDYLLNQHEAERVADSLSNQLDGGTLKDMYASDEWEKFAENLIEPIILDVIDDRQKIVLPSEEMFCDSLKEVLEEIADEAVV